MRVRVGGRDLTGRAVDLTAADVDPQRLAAAVRGDDGSVGCPSPGPAHDHVGVVAPSMALARRSALAAAARSRGLSPPQAEQLAAVRERLDGLDPPDVGLSAPRERAATAAADRERLRERVATLQGRVRALREAGVDPSEAEAALAAAARDLAEAETEHVAAREALDRARERAREARDVRERRLRLEDRRANLERAARAWLADQVRADADAAVRATPGSDATGIDGAGDATAALAVARVADLRAPVVVACRRFDGARAAADWLDAPVIRV